MLVEGADLLGLSFFEDGEVGAGEAVDRVAGAVGDDDVLDDEVGAGLDGGGRRRRRGRLRDGGGGGEECEEAGELAGHHTLVFAGYSNTRDGRVSPTLLRARGTGARRW